MSQKGQWYEDFEVPDLVTMVAQNEIFFFNEGRQNMCNW